MGDATTLLKSRFPSLGIIQPTLWEFSSGNIHLARSTAGRIYRSDSQDNGQTWSPAYPTPLLNNNSGIDLVRLDNSSLILGVYLAPATFVTFLGLFYDFL